MTNRFRLLYPRDLSLPLRVRLLESLSSVKTAGSETLFPALTKVELTRYVKTPTALINVLNSKPENIYFKCVPKHAMFKRTQEYIERTGGLPNRSGLHQTLLEACALNNYPRRARFSKPTEVYVCFSQMTEMVKPNKFGYSDASLRSTVLARVTVQVERNPSNALRITRGK